MNKFLLIALILLCGCEVEDEIVNQSACNQFVIESNDATTAYQSAIDEYDATGEYPDGTDDLCIQHYANISVLIDSDCENDLGPYEGYTSAEIDSLSINNCAELP